MACGNFGARPKPPHAASNCTRDVANRLADGSQGRGATPRSAGRRICSSIAPVSLSACSSTSARCSCHASATTSHTLGERRHAVPVLVGVVGAAVERAAVGRQPHRHRPAAAAGQRLHRLHVDRVDVGPFLAVDLHVHEQPVHDVGRCVVLERLVRHDVAPVARRVADREEDRLVLVARLREGLVAPRIPVDRVVAVLVEVRAGLVGQAIHAATLSSPADDSGRLRPAVVGLARR